MAELALAFWRHAKTYYRKDGRPTAEAAGIRVALRNLRETYGSVPVADFGPLALKATQIRMIELGHSRAYVNANVHRIRGMFRWGVAEELVPAQVYHALTAVSGLRKGRTTAREAEPVEPVARAIAHK